MDILLFPTRFYPAISGGDFYLQRLGEFYQKKKNTRVHLLSSNAMDFGSIKGQGKFVKEDHRNFKKYHNLTIHRFKIGIADEFENNSLKLIKLCSDILKLPLEFTQKIILNGPILPNLIEILEKKSRLDFLEIISLPYSLRENQFKPSLIHCTYLPYSNLLYSLLIAQIMEIPAFVTPFLHSSNLRYKNPEFFRVLEKFDGIFACTEFEKKIYIENGILATKIKVLPMGVDFEKFQQDYKPLIRESFPIHSELILFCGNKNYEKGALSLLKTIPLIASSNFQPTYLFIGPPTTAFNYTLTQIRKNHPEIQIFNLTPENLSGIFDKKKIGAFQLAQIFCMPSRSDAYGIAYLEAWATKTPVIAANFPAQREFIKNGENGFLVEFDNPEQLKNAIIKLLKNPKSRIEMGMNGFHQILKNNNWNYISQDSMEFYTQTLKKGIKKDGFKQTEC